MVIIFIYGDQKAIGVTILVMAMLKLNFCIEPFLDYFKNKGWGSEIFAPIDAKYY